MFFKALHDFLILPALYVDSTSPPTRVIFSLFKCTNPSGYKQYLFDFDSNSLMATDVEHLFSAYQLFASPKMYPGAVGFRRMVQKG